MSITISHTGGHVSGSVKLPSSKSESNRLLILQALSKGEVNAENLSDARDTRLMLSALSSKDITIDVQDAGTTMRFLTAYFCATDQHKVLTGSERMCERPIGVLVDALREIGFKIAYKGKEGFPPLEILPVDDQKLKKEVHIAGNISSQYITALLLIAPVLPEGLTIHFTTTISSKPYIELTLDMLAKAGITHVWNENSIRVSPQSFGEISISASADWSAAGYWFSVAALSHLALVTLNDLTFDTEQGDKIIADWAKEFGVDIKQQMDGVLVKKSNQNLAPPHDLHFDFTDHPDLAQTIIVLCAAKGIKATFSGLESLRIKETDRVKALQEELLKFGLTLSETDKGLFTLSGSFRLSKEPVKTYNDHRMAMAFAPLALLGEITIESPDVVAKSYPDFWEEMKKHGFLISPGIPR